MPHHPHALWAEAIPNAGGQGPQRMSAEELIAPGFLVSQPGEADTVLDPAIAFVRTERVPPRGGPEEQRYWRLAPDLVAEVASPSDIHPEMAAKAMAWLASGVRMVWIVWPAVQTVDVWKPSADAPARTLSTQGQLEDADLLPGFSCPVARLFA